MQDLVVKYRADLDPVLKGVSFSVRGREKVTGGVGVGWGHQRGVEAAGRRGARLEDLQARAAQFPMPVSQHG